MDTEMHFCLQHLDGLPSLRSAVSFSGTEANIQLPRPVRARSFEPLASSFFPCSAVPPDHAHPLAELERFSIARTHIRATNPVKLRPRAFAKCMRLAWLTPPSQFML